MRVQQEGRSPPFWHDLDIYRDMWRALGVNLVKERRRLIWLRSMAGEMVEGICSYLVDRVLLYEADCGYLLGFHSRSLSCCMVVYYADE